MGSIENGVSRDAERDRQAKEAYKRKKKENDERSEFSDEMSSLYRKCASLAMKMIKFDRTRLNIEVVNKNVIDKSKDKYGPFIKPKVSALHPVRYAVSTLENLNLRVLKAVQVKL